MEKHRGAICDALQQATGMPADAIIWRPAMDMLREEGCHPEQGGAAGAAGAGADDGAAAAAEGEEEGEGADDGLAAAEAEAEEAASEAAALETVVVCENGLQFEAAPRHQKTGERALGPSKGCCALQA